MEREVLTGEAAALYLGAMIDSANHGRPLNARALARDALLAQRSNRAAMTRLRAATVRVRPIPAPHARTPRRRASRISRGVAVVRCASTSPPRPRGSQ